jgi:hypothetical protein
MALSPVLTVPKSADLRDGRRRNGAAGKMRLRQVILQAADFKPKHRPLSLAQNVRLSVWPKSNACRPCLPHYQTCNSTSFRCSSMRMQRKMPLRPIVLDRTTVVFTGGTTITTGQSVAPRRRTPSSPWTFAMRQRMKALEATSM